MSFNGSEMMISPMSQSPSTPNSFSMFWQKTWVVQMEALSKSSSARRNRRLRSATSTGSALLRSAETSSLTGA